MFGSRASAPAAFAAPGASRAPTCSPVSSPITTHTGFMQPTSPGGDELPCLSRDPGTAGASSLTAGTCSPLPPMPAGPTGAPGDRTGEPASSEGAGNGLGGLRSPEGRRRDMIEGGQGIISALENGWWLSATGVSATGSAGEGRVHRGSSALRGLMKGSVAGSRGLKTRSEADRYPRIVDLMHF